MADTANAAQVVGLKRDNGLFSKHRLHNWYCMFAKQVALGKPGHLFGKCGPGHRLGPLPRFDQARTCRRELLPGALSLHPREKMANNEKAHPQRVRRMRVSIQKVYVPTRQQLLTLGAFKSPMGSSMAELGRRKSAC